MIRLEFNESDKVKVFAERFSEPAERVRRWLMEWVGEPSLDREGHLPHVPESVFIRIADEEVRLVTTFEGLRSFSILLRRNPNNQNEQSTPNSQGEQGIPIRGRRGAHDVYDKLLLIEVLETGDGCEVRGYCVPEVGVVLNGENVGMIETRYREYLLGLREALVKAMKPDRIAQETAKSRQRKMQRDELIMGLWRQGYQVDDIAHELKKHGYKISAKSVRNLIFELRKKYGVKRVPMHRQRKVAKSESEEQV
jgi:hypothetical protein